MRRTLLSAIAMSAIGLSAHAGPAPTDLINKPLKVKWKGKAGKDAGPVDFAAAYDRLFAISWKGDLFAFDAKTGKRAWRKKPRKRHDFEHGQIAAAGGVVVWLNAEDPQLLGLDPAKGKVKWKIELEAPPGSLDRCDGSRLVVATHRGPGADGKETLLARGVDPTDGTTRWRTPVPGEIAGTGGGYIFTYKRSGVGRLNDGLTAVRCATGEAKTLSFGSRAPYLSFLGADGDWMATAHGANGSSYTEVCVTRTSEGGGGKCFSATDGEVPTYSVSGGMVSAAHERVYFSTSHTAARNLDPSDDGWLFAYDVNANKVVARSSASSAGLGPIDAGAVLLSGFGSTGADDFAFLLDPADLRRVGTVAVSKAPTQLAVDAERGYVGAYDGSIRAFELPLPGPKPAAEAVVDVSGSAQPGVEKVEPLGFTVERIIDAHPKKGRSSGMKMEGLARSVAWLAGGERLAVGGNDDKVRVIDPDTGKRLWLSKSLKKDVTHLAGCPDGRVAALNYNGALTVFSPKGKKRYTASKTVKAGQSWTFGATAACGSMVVGPLSGPLVIYDGKTHSKVGEVPSSELRGFDDRGLRVSANRVVIPRAGGFTVYDLSEGADAELDKVQVEGAYQAHGGNLSQVWMATTDQMLKEYCSAQQCVVELSLLGGRPTHTMTFDISGSVWSPSVPSHIEVSPDGRWMFWARRGLEAVVVEIATGKQQAVRHIARSTGRAKPATEGPVATFAPDGRLAIGMYPEPWQVLLIRPSATER